MNMLLTRHKPIKIEQVDESRVFLINLLPLPGKLIWPEKSADFVRTRAKCRNTLDQDYWPLLDLSILTSKLLNLKTIGHLPQNTPLLELYAEYLPELPPEKVMKFSWKPVPVLGATPMGSCQKAEITWYILGHMQAHPLSSCWPDWAAELMDVPALAAIKDAFSAAHNLTGIKEHLYIFPLISRKIVQGKILRGRSLGLPIAIAASQLLLRLNEETPYIATGDILSGAGKIGPVNNQTLAAKAQAAADAGYSLFLYPQENAASLACHIENIHLKPVTTLQQARLWADCLTTPAMVPDVQRLDTALQSSTDFINNMDNLPSALLDWVHSSGTATDLIEEICSTPDMSSKLAEKLRTSLRHNKDNYQIPVSIAGFICEEKQINKIGETNPAAALSWCSSHLALANHKGNNAKSHFWWNIGNRFTQKACETEYGRRICPEFFNRFFGVGDRHNHFHFAPDLPEKFTDHLQHIENLHRLTCKMGECSNYMLGSMYGTVGQNYAFCGPEFLGKSIQYLLAAQKAFGSADTKNCQQEDSYLFFAYLDAGPTYTAKAAEKLCAALTVSSIDEIQYAFLKEKYNYFALLRALIEIPKQFRPDTYTRLSDQTYTHFTTVMTEIEKGLHPWQLWCYNLGRLAEQQKKPTLAVQAWQTSLNLCERGDETIKIMGLLPLAALWRDDQSNKEICSRTKIILNQIKSSPYIHQAHFQKILIKSSMEDVLEFVSQWPHKLFPFNYR